MIIKLNFKSSWLLNCKIQIRNFRANKKKFSRMRFKIFVESQRPMCGVLGLTNVR